MTSLLNLDELQPEVNKQLTLKGKTHDMQPIKVGSLIKNSKKAKKLDGVEDLGEIMDIMISMIMEVFPTIERKDLEDLTMEHLNKILEFVRADIPEEIKEQEGNA